LAAWHALLRPGGTIIAFVPAFMALWSEHDVVNHHQHRYRLNELSQAFRQARFRVVRSSYWNFILFPPTALVRVLKRSLSGSTNGVTGQGDLALPATAINGLLLRVLKFENFLMRHGVTWPWGVSAMVVGVKSES
jgi:hypothetical protein